MVREIRRCPVPGHVGIILDGNRRYARERGLLSGGLEVNGMRIAAKRMTFRLHQPTVAGINALVQSGLAPSRNTLIEALVDQALQEEVLRAFAAADADRE